MGSHHESEKPEPQTVPQFTRNIFIKILFLLILTNNFLSREKDKERSKPNEKNISKAISYFFC
jgi:hypothetical protein